MGLRFYRRVRIIPGVSMNFSLSGPSVSVGVRGAHVTVGRRGIRKAVGLPGTGVYYTTSTGYHTGVQHDGAGGGWLAVLVAFGIAFLLARLSLNSR
jgi:hypothetical protein